MQSRFQQRFIDLAYQHACAAPRHFRISMVAVLVHRNRRIVSIQTNSRKTHPFQARYAKNRHAIYLHAENNVVVDGLRKIGLDELANCSLYLARACLDNDGNHYPGLCKPCAGCQRCLVAHGVRSVYYTSGDGVDVL